MSRHEKKNMPLEAVCVENEYADLAIPDFQASNPTSPTMDAEKANIPNTAKNNVQASLKALDAGINDLCRNVDDIERVLGHLEKDASAIKQIDERDTSSQIRGVSSVLPEGRGDTTQVDIAPVLTSEPLGTIPQHGTSVSTESVTSASPSTVEQKLEQMIKTLDQLVERLEESDRRLSALETQLKQSEPAFGDVFLQQLDAIENQNAERNESPEQAATLGIGRFSRGNSWWRLNPSSPCERPLTVDSPGYSSWSKRYESKRIEPVRGKKWKELEETRSSLSTTDSHDLSALTIPSAQRALHSAKEDVAGPPVIYQKSAPLRPESRRPLNANADDGWLLSKEIQEGIQRVEAELDELREDVVEIGGRIKSLVSAIGSFFGGVFDAVTEQLASTPSLQIRTRAPSTWESDLQAFFDSHESVKLVDTDGNGFFEAAELRFALANKELKGADAAVVSQFLERYETLIQLSNDEWFTEDSGITVADLQAVHSGESRVLRENLSYWYKDLVQRWNDKPSTLFGTEERITIDAFEQDGVGDCYLLAVAGSLATLRPEALREMFSVNEDGTVRVDVKGGFRGQFDVEMPQDGEILTYARVSKKHGIWPQVLERAVGRYRRQIARFGIFGTETHHAVDDGGSLKDVIELLTGHKAVFDYLKTSSASGIEKTMADAINDNRVTTLSTGRAVEGRETVEGTSLLYSHAYSVVGYDRESRLFTIVDPNKTMSVRPEGGDGYMRLNAEQIKELFSWSAIETNEDISWSVFSV